MATKPSAPATWDDNETNMIAPDAGHITDGFATSEVVMSDELNGQLNLIGKWTEYLYDGDLGDVQVDNIVVNGSVTFDVVDYALTANTTGADPMGDGTTNGVRVINITPDSSGWTLGGLVGGVDGREIDLVNVGAAYFSLSNERSAATAANRFTLPELITTTADDVVRVYPGGAVRLRYHGGSSRWRVVDLSGCSRHRYLTVGAASAILQNGSGSDTYGTHSAMPSSGGYWDVDGYTTLDFPIVLPVGAIIESYTVYLRKNSNASYVIASTIVQRNGSDGTQSARPTATLSTDAPGFSTALSDAGITMIVSASNSHYVTVQRNPSTGSADVIYHVAVGYWDLI